jgi:HlyD family secretion protein
VLIAVDPTDVQLLPDMTATVAIVTASADNAVLVPNGAISSSGSVAVLRNGSPVSVPVVTGISDGVNSQIVSGLQAGDQVVTGTVSGNSSAKSSSSGGSSIFGSGGQGGTSPNRSSSGGTQSTQRGG